MPILSSELKFHASALISDSLPAQNGGRPAAVALVSGVKNNLLPDVSAAQRAAGATTVRKLFLLAHDDTSGTLVAPKVSLESPTPGAGYALLYPGTWTDTQATRSARPYAVGALAAGVSAGATSLSVTCEASLAAANPWRVGDTLRVDARATVEGTGAHEYTTITSVSYSGVAVTLGVTALANAYAAGAFVASAITPGDLAASVTGKATSGGASYDDSAQPIVVPQVGGIYQTWTVTVTNGATGALSVVGDLVGPVGTGSTGADLAPANPAGGSYFVLQSEGWVGTPSTGATLTFTTVPAGCALWVDRVTPAGAAATPLDSVVICAEGETV